MFGKNEIVGKNFFKNADGKYFVTTIFGPTIQGEGPFAGQPAIFVRLAKCNLNCSFCDTYFDDGDWFTLDDLVQAIHDKIPSDYVEGSIGVVVTGGEPSLQNIQPLVDDLDITDKFSWVQIETNGILPIWTNGGYLVVSPKCSEKTGKYLKIHDEVKYSAYAMKFVISADPKSPYHDIPDWAHHWAKKEYGRIYISPMNIYNEEPRQKKESSVKNHMTLEERSVLNETVSFWTPGLLNLEENQKNHEYAAQYCLKHGYRLNLQMHLYASLP